MKNHTVKWKQLKESFFGFVFSSTIRIDPPEHDFLVIIITKVGLYTTKHVDMVE